MDTLITAIKNKLLFEDIEKLFYIEKKSEKNIKTKHDKRGLSVAMLAVWHPESERILRFLLDNKAIKFNKKDDKGNTILHHLAKHPYPNQELLRDMLDIKECKATVNEINNNDFTPLCFAAKRGNVSSIKKLIGYGADITMGTREFKVNNSGKNNSQHPMTIAIKKGYSPNVVRTFFDLGASFGHMIDWHEGESFPITVAVKHYSSYKWLNHLISLEPEAFKNEDLRREALLYSVSNHSPNLTKYIVSLKLFNQDMLNEALCHSVYNRYTRGKKANLHAIELLLRTGAHVNWKDSNGNSVIHSLFYTTRKNGKEFANSIKALEILEKYGVDINGKDEEGDTILHIAALVGGIDTVKYLIDKGMDINAKNDIGQNTLFFAAEWAEWCVQEGRIDVLKFLLGNGADMNIIDNDGNSILQHAKKSRNFNIKGNKEKYKRIKTIIQEHKLTTQINQTQGEESLWTL